jgi:hypothetical protein
MWAAARFGARSDIRQCFVGTKGGDHDESRPPVTFLENKRVCICKGTLVLA